jgi:CDP-glycerol glycerophosphotransferase (TagB/SpsB family)
LYLLSYFIPRNKNVWVFGAWLGRRYADNSRHVYEYVCENRKNIRAIWLSRNPDIVDYLRKNGREVYLISSFWGFWFSCRASVVISSNGKMDVNRPAISKAIKIQLWHGIPLKKIGPSDEVMPCYHYGWRGRIFVSFHHAIIGIKKAIFPFLLENWDFIISTSPVISERMASAYGVSESRVVITGYPRNDILLNGQRRLSSAFNEIFETRKFKKFILYAPTFRNRYEDNVSLFNGFDLQKMDSCLKKHDALFMIKMHPIFDAATLMIKDVTTPHMYWIQEKDISELNELLPHVDLLITDYSGAYLDYLLLDKPIIFTPFDLERYVKMDRDLYEDYDDATPGVKCKNWTEVLNELDIILSGEDHYRIERLRALNKYHSYCDMESSKRVYELAKSLLEQRTV